MHDRALPSRFDELRRRAEEMLNERGTVQSDDMDMLSLIHELEVHQVELQIQNEELRAGKMELEASRSQYAALFDHAPVGYLNLDRKALITKFNIEAGKILGTTADRWFDNRFYSLIHPEDQGIFWSLIKNFSDSHRPNRTCEVRILRKTETGASVAIRMEIAGTTGPNGKIDGWRVAFVDITGQREMEEELRRARDELELRVRERTTELAEANSALRVEVEERKRTQTELRLYMKKLEESNRELQDFAFIASHDLHEPLRKILTFSEMLIKSSENALNETNAAYLERVQSAAARMRDLLDALLKYSRVGMQAASYSDCNLTEAARDAASDLELLIYRTRGKVEISDLPVVQADTVQIRQLFQNLIENALKFGKDEIPPLVKVYALPGDNNKCRIAVEDNGIGFDQEFAEKIFSPFQRLHGRSSKYEGTGMGLAICRKIVDRHGGSIAAKSIQGKSSTFIVSLPCRQKPQSE